LFTIYEDTGGAHPNGFYRTFVFDEQGSAVKLSDLFLPAQAGKPGSNYLQKISAAATAQVTKQLQEGLGQADVSGDIFAEGLAPTVENFKNFVIDGDTLYIVIPPYQAAAYVAGSFDVRIPFGDLKNLLKAQ
jgi:hypothetical protein